MSHDDMQQYYDDCTLLVGLFVDEDGTIYGEFIDGREWLS